MTPRSAAAADAARRLWARTVGDARSAEKVAAAAEQACTQLQTGLGRWIGTEGFRALQRRALAQVRQDHPALIGLACLEGDDPVSAAEALGHDPDEVAAGMIALVAAVIDLLSVILGEEMAMRLVEQTGTPSPRGIVSIEKKAARNG